MVFSKVLVKKAETGDNSYKEGKVCQDDFGDRDKSTLS